MSRGKCVLFKIFFRVGLPPISPVTVAPFEEETAGAGGAPADGWGCRGRAPLNFALGLCSRCDVRRRRSDVRRSAEQLAADAAIPASHSKLMRNLGRHGAGSGTDGKPLGGAADTAPGTASPGYLQGLISFPGEGRCF